MNSALFCMHRLLLLLIFPVFLFQISASVYSQELWNGAEYGDSIQAIQKKFPGALPPIKSDRLRENGVSALIALPVQIANRDFDAHFRFNEKGLTGIILIAKELLSDAEADATENTITSALAHKYGTYYETADLLKTATGEEPLWMAWISNNVRIMFVPQHKGEKIMIAYDISAEERTRIEKEAADSYLKNTSATDAAGLL